MFELGKKLAMGCGTAYEHIDFGINSYGDYGDGLGRPDWFENARVRQAVAMCTNRQGMVNEILYGRSEVMHSYLPQIHPLYPDNMPEWSYDPDQANALLDEVGYLDSDGDGWREDPLTGTPFRVTLTTSSGSDLRQQVTQIFQANLIDCGIDVQLEFVPTTILFAGGDESGPLFGRQFDLGEFAWITGPNPDCWLFLSEFIPGPIEEGFAGWDFPNDMGWQNPTFDAACQTGLNSLPGTESYVTAHQEALRTFAQDLPILPLFLQTKVAATRPEVVNLALDPTQESELWNIFEIDLEFTTP